MTNHRLRGAMLSVGLTPAALASAVEADAKTVGRWLAGVSTPYPTTRIAIARIVGYEESFLWPSLVGPMHAELLAVDGAVDGQISRVWSERRLISIETWHELFSRASVKLDILVYSGAFLIESLDLADVLAWHAARGTRVRVLVGDPGGAGIKARAAELALDWLPQRCQTTMDYLRRVDGIEVRANSAVHYVSLFRFDDVLLANTHAFGIWACHSPVVRVSKDAAAGLFKFYAASFEMVWARDSKPRTEVC